MSSIEQRINDLGYTLPETPSPVANYVPALLCGTTLQTSGQIPMQGGSLLCTGSVPSEQSIEHAVEAAQVCCLNTLAVAGSVLDGDLDRIQRVLHVRVYVASDPGFTDHSVIANGASDLFVAIFGDSGKHTRVAMGSSGLPLGATVEVEALFFIRE